MDPVSAGLGAATLISGKSANKKAEGQANAAGKRARSLEDRAAKLFDVLFANADNAVKSGTFDPEKRIAQLESDTARYEGKDMGNLAGALTTAGYRPGDSEIGTRLDSVKSKYRNFLDTMRDQIRTGSAMDIANIYSTANAGLLQPGIAGARGTQQQALSGMQSPAGFLSAIMPALNNRSGSSGGAAAGFALGKMSPNIQRFRGWG